MPTTRTAKRPIITTAKPNTQGRTAQGSAYIPRPDSVPDRVCRFFASNPDEQLDTHDIAAKFDSRSNNVHTQLALCVGAGLLTRERDDELGYIYTAGPRLATSPYAALAEAAATDTSGLLGGRLPETAAALAAAMAKAKPAPRRAPHEHQDPATLQIRTDLTPPANQRGGLGAPDYKTTMLTMPVGACFDIAVRSRFIISKQMTELHKRSGPGNTQRWRSVMLTPDTLRVWRVA